MASKVGTPKGTRDFGPEEMIKRKFIFNTIESVYKKYGFLPIETPAMENLSVLMGKYGEEGDRLLFKILNSGDFLSKVNENEQKSSANLLNKISEKGLRYDLTVPFARFVVQHRNEVILPFRRYQMQPVWRADRPQKGRYREFYQCDADVVGSESLNNEVELIQIICDVFEQFGLDITIKVNSRKILTGFSQVIGEPDRITEITNSLDKIDKIGKEKMFQDLSEKGFSEAVIERLRPVVEFEGKTAEKLEFLEVYFKNSDSGSEGIKEIRYILDVIDGLDLKTNIELDINLARGLNYYTGTIIEVKSNEMNIGSISGGGRYDNLTGVFGMSGLSGVGISFGAERIFDVLEKLNRFPVDLMESTKVLFIPLGEVEFKYVLPVVKNLREENIACEIYPDFVKMKKIMNYANSRNIPFVVIVGNEEVENNSFTLKDMASGEQMLLKKQELLNHFV
jgi:histidyl-tRNA synthetase